jgi:hypothetical protein
MWIGAAVEKPERAFTGFPPGTALRPSRKSRWLGSGKSERSDESGSKAATTGGAWARTGGAIRNAPRAIAKSTGRRFIGAPLEVGRAIFVRIFVNPLDCCAPEIPARPAEARRLFSA